VGEPLSWPFADSLFDLSQVYIPRRMIASHRVLAVLVPLMACASPASAQSNPRMYAGGTLTGYFQTDTYQPNSGPEPFGGNGWSASGLFGGWVSRWIGVEVESSFGPMFSNQYSTQYSNETATRHDTFWTGQVRVRVGALEPVFGLAYHHTHFQIDTGPPYATHLDVSGNGVAPVLGVDAPIRVASRVDVLPTIRVMFADGGGGTETVDAMSLTKRMLVFRYGVGVRVRF
jgi:hypothetical protein